MSKEQVFVTLLNEERHFTTWTALRKKYKNSNLGENYMGIRKKKIYKDYCDEFEKMPEQEKDKLLCLYTEMYIE